MAVAAEGALPLVPLRSAGLAPVRLWLYLLAALVVAMVAVGGATRLTGAGLAITEWKPVTGAVPPLTEEAWRAEFEKYRQIPQYELVNRDMTLGEFKYIYAWEWGHRQLGRLIGLSFFLPLAWFWARRLVTGRLALSLLAIGALGGLQGAIGWLMVASGLEPGMTAVAPIKLALHLAAASLIFACLIWVAASLAEARSGSNPLASDPVLLLAHSPHFRRRTSAHFAGKCSSPEPALAGAKRGSRLILALVFLQIALGGLVAGSRAGLTYNTWPLMDGALVPSGLLTVTPWIENFVDNVTLVQFNHRMVAYAVVAAALWQAWRLRTAAPASRAARQAAALAGASLCQMALGILTLLLAVPLWAGLAHQVFAMVVLAMAVSHAQALTVPAPPGQAATMPRGHVTGSGP